MSAETDDGASVEMSKLNTQDTDQTDSVKSEDSAQKPNWLAAWAKNREGATAWFLLFRVFLFNSLTGINYVLFSLLYVEYSIYFEAPKATLGLIRSIQTAALILGDM